MHRSLSRTHGNDVFQALRSAGLDPNDFAWAEVPSVNLHGDTVPHLMHRRQSNCFFTFDFRNRSSEYWLIFSPGTATEQQIHSTQGGWIEAFDFVKAWVARVEAQVEAPDLWAESAKERALAEASASAGDEKFTAQEQQILGQKLDEIEAYARDTYSLAGESQALLEGQVGYVRGAIGRLGKRDWLGVLYATLINLAVRDLVPTGAVPDLLRFAWTAVQVVFGNTPELPPVSPPS